jgi:hypothetical protein
MDNVEQQASSGEVMKLRTAFKIWGICLGIFILLCFGGYYFDLLGAIAFFFYLGAGFYLNRNVLARLVEWHPVYNTLDNVTSEKLKFFIGWPILYLPLFVKLGIDKVL